MEVECKVEKIGDYLTTDSEGYLLNTTNISNIQPDWKIPVDEVVQACIDHYGANLHSVYLRGSVAKGQAIENISDIDIIAILLDNVKIKRDWIKNYASDFKKKFPFINGIDLQTSYFNDLKNRPGLRILIKTQSICFHGT